MYQKDWFGIKFRNTNSLKIADSNFYNDFYTDLFKKYADFQSLPNQWKKQKEMIAKFLITKFGNNQSVLSIGCGLGYIESYIVMNSNTNLFVHDFSSSLIKWLSNIIPNSNRIIGDLSTALNNRNYGYIFMSAFDYALTDEELIDTLKALNKKKCEIIIISASFEEEKISLKDKFKKHLKRILINMRIFNPGQFWGWTRTEQEYKKLLTDSGYKIKESGFIDQVNRNHFYLTGCPK